MPSSLRAFAAISCIVCALVLFSCSASQSLVIAADGSGTFSMHAEVSALLKDYLVSLAGISGTSGPLKDGRVFDAAAITKDLQSRPGIVVQKASAPASNVLDLELGFDSLQDLAGTREALKDAGAISIVDEQDRSTLRLHLDRTTWGQLARLFPPLRDPLIAQLGPQADGNVTDDDYLAMIRFSIGDAAPALLKKSFLTLTVQPEGQIISQSGGTVSDGIVTFRIPVLRVLVLDRPLDYSVTWARSSS
jgi:hypothetical protein